MDLDALRKKLRETSAVRVTGRVLAVTGLAVRFALPGVRVGDVVRVRRRGDPLSCEVVGFSRGEAIGMPLGDLAGIGPDDEVEATGGVFRVPVSEGLLGRVVDGLGRPIDGGPDLAPEDEVPARREPPRPLERRRIDRVLATGVRVLDAAITLGEGQRIGLFAGSGVGKSALLGSVARGAEADVVICALVGERGREVGEFLDQALGPAGRARSVVVVATSDAPALERRSAAEVATAYAEWFRDRRARVLLLVDSVTRYARALREVGLAAGEAPARRGYPPSVFAALPRLLERSGQARRGSISAIYTVLVEGGDLDEPVADEVRGILDGHVVLDRALAARGRYPAVDVPGSLSRLMDGLVTPEHRRLAARLRGLLDVYERKRDLVAMGAYVHGVDRSLDEALLRLPELERFLSQRPEETTGFAEALERLEEALG